MGDELGVDAGLRLEDILAQKVLGQDVLRRREGREERTVRM